jgi:CelD/BcsL family acetyltransferase involved in cellulose biosynthesis
MTVLPVLASALSAESIEDAASLAALAPDWWALWRRVPAATPFQSPAWLLAWWRSFAPGRLASVALRRDGRLVALAPLYREESPRGARLLPLGISLSDYLDLLLEPQWEGPLGAAIFDRLLSPALAWERCELEELPPGAAALAMACPRGCAAESEPQSACPVLELPDGVDDLPRAVPSRMLRKLRMARHRAARRGGIALRRADAATLEAELEALFALHGARWEERGEAGVMAAAAVRRFHREAAPALLEAGLLRLYSLSIGGARAGVYYGFIHGESAYAYLAGFDPAFAFESPGTILIGHAIEEAIREGARAFHFLRGGEAYKYRWGARDRWNMRRCIRRVVP